MTPEDLQALVALGREQRHVEFNNSVSDLFYRFGWRGTIDALRGIQQQQSRGR